MPSTSLRNQYNDVSNKCKEVAEPIFVTKNGEGDMVIMSLELYERERELLKLKERLLDIEIEQKSGAKYYSLEELNNALRKIVNNE